MTSVQACFVQLTRLAVCDEHCADAELKRVCACEPIDWNGICELAKKNCMEALIYHAARMLPDVPAEVKARLHDDFLRKYARDAQQQFWLEHVQQLLLQADIPFALLKGSVLRDDYPMPCLRYKSDIDFYIRPEDRQQIHHLLTGNGGVFRGTESGDEQFSFTKTVGMEFHGRLLYRKTQNGIENYPDWSFVLAEENRLTEEGYALNLFGHAVSDITKGGPGVRFLLDLWIYRNRHQPQPDWNKVRQRLQQDGILEAAEKLTDLSEMLFGTLDATPLLQELADYVLQGGLYGKKERRSAAEAARTGGKGKALWRQVFRSRKEFENRFPWLKRFPFLLPVAWVIRVFQSLGHNRRAIRKWRRGMRSLSKEEIAQQKENLKRFGL